MDITFLGHSSFKIKGKSHTIVTDPFDPSIGINYPKVEADLVTISHDHFDHNNISKVAGYKKVFSEPGEYEVGGTSIFGIPSFHDDKKGELRGKNTIFVIEMDGVKIAHLGDLGHTLSESQVEEIGNIDILMVPVGGEYTIGHADAVDVVQSIEPKVILPMHYKLKGLSEEKFGKLEPVENFVSALGVKSENLPKLVFRLGDLPEDEERLYILEVK